VSERLSNERASSARPAGDPVFPIPVPDDDTRPFWDGVERGELLVQRCAACDRRIWQPSPVCPSCGVPDPAWLPIDGAGTIASWIVVRPPTLPAYADHVPLVVLLVELAEGVRMLGYLVDDSGGLIRTDGEAEGVAIGRRVDVRFHDQAGTRLPCWSLVD
jgi:uncharacterized OB-fold protein